MPIIKTRKGHKFLVDSESYPQLVMFSWYKTQTGYAGTRIDGKQVLMHRMLKGNPIGEFVDHINNDRTDNRMVNLRTATHAENNRNRSKGDKPAYSRYVGVCFNKPRGRWQAYASKDSVMHCGGFYKTEREAAIARNKLAIKLHGVFAKINKIIYETA